MADNNLTPKEEFLLNPVEEHNIENAAVATFETNLKHGLKVTVPMAPIQDLHGMPYPYPAGASVNLIPDGTDTSNGYVANRFLQEDGNYHDTATGSYYISEYFPVTADTIYTWSNTLGTEQLSAVCFYDSNFDYIIGYRAGGLASQNITTPSDATYARSTQSYPTATNAKYQFELGSTATEYRRYSNICPISGLTSCCLYDTNSDLYNKETGEFDFSETQLGTGTPSATNYRQIVPGLVLTRDDSTEITVYGGSLKVNSDGTGVLTAKRGVLKWTSDRQPSKLNNAYSRTATVWSANTYLWGGSGHICDRAIWKGNTSGYSVVGCFSRAGTSWTFVSPTQEIYDIVDDAEWLAAMKTWLDANPITICSKLGTYKTYTLSATETARALKYLGIELQSVPISWKHADGTYDFEPIQEGEGDPSPDNVRPITPALTLTRDDNSVLTVYGGSITFRDDGTSRLVEDRTLITVTSVTTHSETYSNYNATLSTAREFDLVYPCAHYINGYI